MPEAAKKAAVRPHQPGQAVFKAILPEKIEWKPFAVFTPPGSACSVTFGKGITPAAPGSAVSALIVSDIAAAHAELVGRGIDASEMWHGASFPVEARLSGPDPKRTSYGSFFAFKDPDGNAWLVQEVTTRAPGRG